MNGIKLKISRVQDLLYSAGRARVVVVGDVMLDQFVWGSVSRISPEAPVPIVDFDHESYMPGGAANVARNLSALRAQTRLFGVAGCDHAGDQMIELLKAQGVDCGGLLELSGRPTTIKTRIVAGQQQVVRVDREHRHELDP